MRALAALYESTHLEGRKVGLGQVLRRDHGVPDDNYSGEFEAMKFNKRNTLSLAYRAYNLLRASGADSGLVVPANIGSTRDEVAHVLRLVQLRRTAFKRVGREVLASGREPKNQLTKT